MQFGFSSRQNFPPKCCQSLPNGIELASVKDYLDDELVLRLTELLEEYETDDPTYCANPKCGIFIPTRDAMVDRYIACPQCDTQTCLRCNGPKDLHTKPLQCPEIISKEDRELVEREGWKQCPRLKCRKVVARSEGCDHMECVCGTEFCYRCGRELNPDEDGITGMACNCDGQNEVFFV